MDLRVPRLEAIIVQVNITFAASFNDSLLTLLLPSGNDSLPNLGFKDFKLWIESREREPEPHAPWPSTDSRRDAASASAGPTERAGMWCCLAHPLPHCCQGVPKQCLTGRCCGDVGAGGTGGVQGSCGCAARCGAGCKGVGVGVGGGWCCGRAGAGLEALREVVHALACG